MGQENTEKSTNYAYEQNRTKEHTWESSLTPPPPPKGGKISFSADREGGGKILFLFCHDWGRRRRRRANGVGRTNGIFEMEEEEEDLWRLGSRAYSDRLTVSLFPQPPGRN